MVLNDLLLTPADGGLSPFDGRFVSLSLGLQKAFLSRYDIWLRFTCVPVVTRSFASQPSVTSTVLPV